MKTLAHGTAAKLTQADLDAADIYLDAKRTIKENEQFRDESKAHLLASLGDLNVGVLPDGRTVRRTRTEFPASTVQRKPYVSETLTID